MGHPVGSRKGTAIDGINVYVFDCNVSAAGIIQKFRVPDASGSLQSSENVLPRNVADIRGGEGQ